MTSPTSGFIHTAVRFLLQVALDHKQPPPTTTTTTTTTTSTTSSTTTSTTTTTTATGSTSTTTKSTTTKQPVPTTTTATRTTKKTTTASPPLPTTTTTTTTSGTPPTTVRPPCTQTIDKLDILFAIDATSKITLAGLNNATNFLKSSWANSNAVNLGLNKTRTSLYLLGGGGGAVGWFSKDSGSTNWPKVFDRITKLLLTDYYTLAEFFGDNDEITTDVAGQFAESNGGRSTANNVVVIFAAANATDPTKAVASLQKLSRLNLKIVVVLLPYGGAPTTAGFAGIASGPQYFVQADKIPGNLSSSVLSALNNILCNIQQGKL